MFLRPLSPHTPSIQRKQASSNANDPHALQPSSHSFTVSAIRPVACVCLPHVPVPPLAPPPTVDTVPLHPTPTAPRASRKAFAAAFHCCVWRRLLRHRTPAGPAGRPGGWARGYSPARRRSHSETSTVALESSTGRRPRRRAAAPLRPSAPHARALRKRKCRPAAP